MLEKWIVTRWFIQKQKIVLDKLRKWFVFIFWSIGNSYFPAIWVFCTINIIRVSGILEIIFMIACAVTIINAKNQKVVVNISGKNQTVKGLWKVLSIILTKSPRSQNFESLNNFDPADYDQIVLDLMESRILFEKKTHQGEVHMTFCVFISQIQVHIRLINILKILPDILWPSLF